MVTQVQVRGTSAGTQNSRTLTSRELDIDTSAKRLNVHDGATAGGIPHANYADVQNGEFIYASASGTDAITLTLSKAPASYVAGQSFRFKAAGTITGSATLNVNSLGALTLKKASPSLGALANLSEGDIIAGVIYTVHVLDVSTALVESLGGGGGLVETQNFSANSALNFPSVFEAGFNYEIELSAIAMATTGTHALIRFTDDNGTTYEATNYAHQYTAVEGGVGVSEAGGTAYAEQMGASLPYSSNNFAGQGINQKMTVFQPALTGQRTGYVYQSIYSSGSDLISVNGTGQFSGDQALTGFQVVTTSGNVTSGSVTLRHLPIT